MAWRGRAAAALVAGAAFGGCAGSGPVGGGIDIVFEEVEAPGAFFRSGRAEADFETGPAGLWAAAPGVPRPERARVRNLDTGAETTVALFTAPAGAAIRLSAQAAGAIGIPPGGDGAVSVVALRREPRLGDGSAPRTARGF